MAVQILKERKKACILAGAVCFLVVTAVYLYAMFRPGLWYGDTFLHQQKDGSFAGSDEYANYRMNMVSTKKGTEILFSVDETVKQYEVINRSDSPAVQIYENDALVFQGDPVSMGDYYLLLDENDSIWGGVRIIADGAVHDIEELFPDYSSLYNWSVMEKPEIWGNPAMLVVILIIAGFLLADVAFPDFFFTLNHRLAVDGGEPSDMYRTGQKISRLILGAGILVCMVLTFIVH